VGYWNSDTPTQRQDEPPRVENLRSKSIADSILAEQKERAQQITDEAAAMLRSTAADARGDAAALLFHRIEELDGLRKQAQANPDLTDEDKHRVEDALLFEEEAHERVFRVYHEQVMDEINREKARDQ
jgi:hypothetical protein